MAIRIILSDIDGCISPEESVAWDLQGFAEFARLSRDASAGITHLPPLTLCTGRPQPYVEALMKILDIRLPVICENGAVIYDLPENRAQYAPNVTPAKITGLRHLRQFIEEAILPAFPGSVLQFGKEAQLSVFSKDPSIFPAMRRPVDDFIFAHSDVQVVISASHFYLNISLAGVDKGSAIRKVLGDLKIGHDEAAGIGDTEGDLPLRDNVAFFACPANATADVKKVADYVSPYPSLRGILDILARPELRR